MTEEDFIALSSPDGRQILAKHLSDDPLHFALTYKNKSGIPTPLLSTQLKYLQRAKSKLPSYYNALCIIPPLSYEQCSSERSAGLKSFFGKNCLDLTCGLGVDALHFSKKFDRVTTLELSPVLASVARHNFRLLGASNMEVINQSAERFLETYDGEPFDLVFADPARRDESKQKVFLFEDCSPNLYDILPRLRQIAKRILIKASPLFDVAEAWKRFPELQSLTVVSVDNECKELLLLWNLGEANHSKSNDFNCDRKGLTGSYSFAIQQKSSKKSAPYSHPLFLLEPDVAFYKGRHTVALFKTYFPELNVGFDHPEGYFYTSVQPPADFPGKVFPISHFEDYQPKILRKIVKEHGLKQANISRRQFPLSVEDLRKTLKLSPGGKDFLFFSQNSEGNLKMIWARPHKEY